MSKETGLRRLAWPAVFLAANLLDWLFTWLLVEQGGAYESNPLAARILRWYGWGGLAVLKTLSVIMVLAVALTIHAYRPRLARRLVQAGCVILIVVIGYSSTLLARFHLDPDSLVLAQEKQRGVLMKHKRLCFMDYCAKVDTLAAELAYGRLSLAEATTELVSFLRHSEHDPMVYLDQMCNGAPREGCLAAHLLRQAGFVLLEQPAAARRILPALQEEFAAYHVTIPHFALEWFQISQNEGEILN